MRARGLALAIVLLALGGAAPAARTPGSPTNGSPATYDVRRFGAIPDGKTKATEAVRRAIVAASAAGGGTILFSGGTYLTGPIRLASHITLEIDAGAVLRFSSDFDDYLPMVPVRWEGTEVLTFAPLIYGDKVDDVAITGRGLIDGGGEPWWREFRRIKQDLEKQGPRALSKGQREFARLNADRREWPDDRRMLEAGFLRPPLIQVRDCHNLSIADVTIKNPPFWTINPVRCDGVTVRGVIIDNPDDSPNTDGIDPDSCRNVHIADCHINAGDDCIAIKSGRDRQGRRIGRATENVTITNCTMLHGHAGVAIGSEMAGSVRRVAVSNCVFEGTDRGIRIKSTRGRGGVVEDIRVSNVVMSDIRNEAITLNLFYTDAPAEPVSERTPHFRHIAISGVTGTAKQAGTLLGLPEAPLEDVSLTDLDIAADSGLVIHDADRVSLRDVRIRPKAGPALLLERARDLHVDGVGTPSPHPAGAGTRAPQPAGPAQR
jgi:polygalacturonase